jgi:Vam6/Vps39-like protein vacuolar protein sorting-associated protein 39
LELGDRVLVGLNSGALRIYRLNEVPPPLKQLNGSSQPLAETPASPPKAPDDQPPSQPATKPTDLLREVEKFSTRAVEQLAIIKEANTLVSLSNYSVSLYDLQTYELLETLGRAKNASCFAVTSNIVKDASTGIPEIISRLGVAVKRRLLLWSWHDGELREDVGEIVLAESIRTVTWASATKAVCGMNAGYVLVDVVSNAVEDIVGPGAIGGAAAGQGSRFGAVSSAGMGYMGLGGYMPKPLATKLADGEMLLAKDINTLFVTDEGKPIEKRQVPWQAAPESIGYSYPYILALQPPTKGSLEIRNPDTLSLLQTISLPGAAQLHFPPPTVSLAHAGKGFHISSERCVWKMGATDYDSQIRELIGTEKFDEAISILNMLEDALLKHKTSTLREIKMLKAEMLFKRKKFRDSMDLFNEDDVHAPPERVLRLFPPNIAGELSAWAVEDEDSDGEVDDGKMNNEKSPKSVKNAKGESSANASSPTKGGGFASMLWKGHRKAISDAASINSSKKDDTDAEDDLAAKVKNAEDSPLEGKDLTNASFELNSYLAGTRARLQRVLDPVTGKLKPRATNGSVEESMKSFLSSYEESEKEVEGNLRRTFQIIDTALFRSYMFSRPSLAGSLFRIPNFCEPDVVNEKLLEHNRYNELVDFFFGKKLHNQALDLLKKFGTAEKPDESAPTLHGPERTILYLQNLPPSEIDLILKHSEWTLKANPDRAMEVFTADSENAETLPRDRVVRFLSGIDSTLEVKYLEHIISELNDLAPEFHNRLNELFIKQLKEKKRDAAWDGVMARFVKFLRESRQYSLNRVFGQIPKDGKFASMRTPSLSRYLTVVDPSFYEAQAVVLSGMGQHKQALEVYVFKMKDYTKAEE